MLLCCTSIKQHNAATVDTDVSKRLFAIIKENIRKIRQSALNKDLSLYRYLQKQDIYYRLSSPKPKSPQPIFEICLALPITIMIAFEVTLMSFLKIKIGLPSNHKKA
uniref:Uncharacterized protein n=1 Tax=Glossina brevipalpis TaxID=37001 RepID=A0A1A9X3D6_9MUSC